MARKNGSAGANDNGGACDIFLHIPKTGGQTFHNLITREYRQESVLDTHCGLLTTQVWDQFIVKRKGEQPRYRAVIGHMKFGLHEILPGPARYATFLRDPVKRFISYYLMLRRMGVVPRDHRFDLKRPDWNSSCHETLGRELDNGQTRALANADWDLPFGECSEEHLKRARANLDRYFGFVGLTERFDLSWMALKRVYGFRWHFYVPKNINPQPDHSLSPEIVEAISGINRFDRQLYAHAQERLEETVRRYGVALRFELGAFVACNAVHQCLHHCRSWKKKLRQALKTERVTSEDLTSLRAVRR